MVAEYNSAFNEDFFIETAGSGSGGGAGGAGGDSGSEEAPSSGGSISGGSTPAVGSTPTGFVPDFLLESPAFNRAPALAIYTPNDDIQTTDIVLTSAKVRLWESPTWHEVNYVGRSIKEVVEEINQSSQRYFAVELNQLPELVSNDLFLNDGDFSPDLGAIVRLNGHSFSYQTQTRLRLLAPYEDDRRKPWYGRVSVGEVVKVLNGVRHVFRVPEYTDQPWSHYYGKPYVDIQDVRPVFVDGRTLRAPRRPLYWLHNNIVVRVNGIAQPSSIIEDVDVENGFIFLATELDPGDPTLLSFTYKETSLVYKGINVNPSVDQLPQFIGQHIVYFLRPQGDSLGRTWEECVFHSVAPTLDGAISQIEVSDDEPVLLLGALQVRQANVVDDVSITDTRTVGGGLKDDELERSKKLNRAMQAVTDLGNLDGVPYPGNAVVLVDLPDSVRTAMTKDELMERIKRHIAFGVVPLVNFRRAD